MKIKFALQFLARKARTGFFEIHFVVWVWNEFLWQIYIRRLLGWRWVNLLSCHVPYTN